MNIPPPQTPGRPLLIGGMHRSGTSLTASLFDAAGVRLGDRLLGADLGNARGHYEDLEIYEFHRSALRACGLGTEGFVASGQVVVPELLQPVGRRLAAERQAKGGVWGWKEPRTTLFLDYWDAILTDARYVFVFRRPWEVVDSLFRRGDDTFAANPFFAAEVWLHYNRTILEFVRRNEDRCLVVELTQVVSDPCGVFAAVRSRLGVDLTDPPDRFAPPLLVRDETPCHVAALGSCLPEALEVYDVLRDRAGSGPREPHVVGTAGFLGRGLLAEWRQARRAEAAAAAATSQLIVARSEAAAAEAAVVTLRTRVASLEDEVRTMQAMRRAKFDRIAALEEGLAALRSDLALRSSGLEVVAARLQSRDGSVLRRLRREIARVGRQIAAALGRLTRRRHGGGTDPAVRRDAA